MALSDSLQNLLRGLVDRPEDLKISVIEDEFSIIVSVVPHPEEFGKLIGKRGVYADAVRKLWSACYRRDGKKFTYNVVDPRRGDTSRSR